MLMLYLLFFICQSNLSSNEKTELEEPKKILEKKDDFYYNPKDERCVELIKEKFGIDSPVYKLLCLNPDETHIEGKKENVASIKGTIKNFQEEHTRGKLPMDIILYNESAESTINIIFNKLFQDKGYFDQHSGMWFVGKAHTTINPILDYHIVPTVYSLKLQIIANVDRGLQALEKSAEKFVKYLWNDFHTTQMPLAFKNFIADELPKIKDDLDKHLEQVTLPIIENKFNALWEEKIVVVDKKIDDVKKEVKKICHHSFMAGKSLSKLIIFYLCLYAVSKKLYYDISSLYQEYILPQEESNRITPKRNKLLSILRKHGMKFFNAFIGITLFYAIHQENKIFSDTLQKIL